MSEKQESGTLHVGVLTPNRRYLISPETHPALFQFNLDTYKNMSIEEQAKLSLNIEQHLPTSSISMLMPDKDHQQDRGYLLGLVRPIDARESMVFALSTQSKLNIMRLGFKQYRAPWLGKSFAS